MSQRKLEEIIRNIAGHNYKEVWYKSDEEVRSAILELFRNAVPPERDIAKSGNATLACEDIEWNLCRTETLRNMSGL